MHWHPRVADPVLRDLDLAGGANDVQHERFGALEAKDVQPFEGNELAKRDREARDNLAQAWRVRHEAGNSRQERRGIDLGHETVGP